MTLMQTAINPYIVCIGARESAAMRISIMGLFNKGAGIVVPLVFSALILSGMERFSEPALAALDAVGREALRNELVAAPGPALHGDGRGSAGLHGPDPFLVAAGA